MKEYGKYDVIYGEFPKDEDSVQFGYRPAIIIQNDIGNKFSPTLLVIPLSSKIKNLTMPTHILIQPDSQNGLKWESVLLAEQTTTISKRKVKKIGRINDRDLQRNIFRCFIFSSAYGNDDEDLKEIQLANG